ncbi:diaminopimelate decarboxylase [Eubacteriales bacterium OttesenSCG-928-M02]|nr:diaminopimelate decarboxylase [Eubacteriales bacterium OttesenSCG-928-M02]
MMKIPFFSAEQLREIVAQYPTPFHIYDEKGIRNTVRKLKRAFSWNKGFKEYFAVKALPNPVILSILKEEGCGVDCSSYTELMMSQRVGFTGEEIMFSSNVTPAEEFLYARELGAIINLDDYTHIAFLQKHGGIPETICLRYNPGGDFTIGNEIMDTPGEAKYGMTKEQMLLGAKELMALGAKRFGIHAFLASNVIDNDYYPLLAKQLFQAAVELQEQTGAEITFINLSGGLSIPYYPDQPAVDIGWVGQEVQKAYEEILTPAGIDAAIYTELGRYMTGPHGCLVATTIHEKHIYKDYIGLDASAVNLMRPAMYGAYHHITVVGKEDWPLEHKYDITGSLCENNDKFAIDRMLPEIAIGDLIVLHDTGAHGFAMGYNYNGKLKSKELLLKEDGGVQLIRRAEQPSDYFATLDVTGYFD